MCVHNFVSSVKRQSCLIIHKVLCMWGKLWVGLCLDEIRHNLQT